MDYPFDTTGLDDVTIETFHETYELLKTKHRIESTGHIDFRLPDFELFRNYTDTKVIGSYAIKGSGNESYILFTETHMKDIGRRGGVMNYCDHSTWALAYLKKDFGRILIRPETLADKIIELVHPVEIDFEDDKAFSDTWYVLANDRWKADAAIDRNFRNAVMDMRHEDVVIEILDHTLIIGYRKPISPDRAMHLADFLVRLCSNC